MGINAVSRRPITNKFIKKGILKDLIYGICEMQGWRPHMEDSHICMTEGEDKIFGIFDGHGGNNISFFVSKYFFKVLSSLKTFKDKNINKALIETFLMLDNLLRLPSMNNILKLLNFSLINNEEIDFDFLKLELVNKESNNNFTPISFYYEPYFNRSSTDLKSICDITHKPLSEASTQLNDIDDLNEKKKDYIEGSSIFIENEFFLEKKFEMTDNKFEYNDITNDIYRFGGTQVDKSTPINSSLVSYSMGTTANVVFISNRTCYIANAGDSMSVLYKNGKAIRLNIEHKLSVNKERERIIKSGTQIINGRISGKLNLTRAIGDHQFKNKSHLKFNQQAVIPLPEVISFPITKDMEFIVMGCDGIWDCVEPQELCDYISSRIREKASLTKILNEVFDLLISKNPDCILIFNQAKIGSDNMTSIIILFKH